MTHNGWSNYETWNVALWLDNDQGTCDMLREWAEEAWEGAQEPTDVGYLTPNERAIRALAKQIQEYIEENNPLAEEASVYSDILSANLSEVNWGEIAKGQIEEVREGVTRGLEEQAEADRKRGDTMTRHTPGPWHVADWSKGPNGEQSSFHPFPVIAGTNGHGIAEVLMGDTKGQANARLIAAAPDMLAALVALCGTPGKDRGHAPLAWEAAAAAIAKARTL